MPQNATLVRNTAQACETLQSIPRWFYALFAIDLTNKSYAHLGIIASAMEKATEAHKLFIGITSLGWRGGLELDRDANVILGQNDFQLSEEFAYRPQGAGRLRFPYATASGGDRFAVGDTANHRILFWRTLPSGEIASAEASAVIG